MGNNAMAEDAEVSVVGGGLAGLVAATEIADAGKRVIVVDQEGEQSLGGQAFWSFGGLFLVDSAEQRRLRIRDSYELALDDWFGTAGFDRTEDHWPRKWAEAYVAFAAGEKRAWLQAQGLRFFPVVVEPCERRVREAAARGLANLKFRHRVDELTFTNGSVDGVRGAILEPSAIARGQASSRATVGEFALKAQAVIVASGGIGGNH